MLLTRARARRPTCKIVPDRVVKSSCPLQEVARVTASTLISVERWIRSKRTEGNVLSN
jgi:hypothetical protein